MALNFKDIKKAIADAVAANCPLIQNVYTYHRSLFEGYPTLTITPSANDADYGDTSKDRRTFVFKLRLYCIIQKGAEHAAAEAALTDALDQMLGVFTDKDVLNLGNGWVEPVPSIWEYEERGDALLRVAEITLRCITYVA